LVGPSLNPTNSWQDSGTLSFVHSRIRKISITIQVCQEHPVGQTILQSLGAFGKGSSALVKPDFITAIVTNDSI